MKPKGITPLEGEEQAFLFTWARFATQTYPELSLLFHIPNGGSRHPAEAVNLKRQGVRKGVPDIFLPVARGGYHGLFVELKRKNGGRVQAEQMNWIQELNAQGYLALVVRGGDRAIDLLTKYIKGELKTNA